MLVIQYSKDGGATWQDWCVYLPGQHLTTYETLTRLKRLYPEWSFCVVAREVNQTPIKVAANLAVDSRGGFVRLTDEESRKLQTKPSTTQSV